MMNMDTNEKLLFINKQFVEQWERERERERERVRTKMKSVIY